ncbi:hypothetical protein EWM62_09365 [Mucilaginibacter terrigena]|uniref:Uncharacterized protein n=1 Tax=Mucilaginibacter terrigena TaxID=2492395 RepID=A0A4V1ZBZ1_9SPHI|nr:DUF5677 domain-containing protein [Mucilaginibacter terrigena]RYU90840.1 hypothetical protein EWM62_09365 [Mucilaginibacter terrigena]
MPITHSLEHLKNLHQEAVLFFKAELSMIKAILPKITDDRIAKTATLLLSSGHTGTALLQLATQTDSFASETVMLARSFMEKLTNFCYANICDEQEYRAFILHPVYKQFHNMGLPDMGADPYLWKDNFEACKRRQEQLKKIDIVKEALTIFSETKSNLNWTKRTMAQRIDAIEKYGKLFDMLFVLSKYHYYSDASEALHGSLYGCTLNIGAFEPGFNPTNQKALEKRSLKDTTCVLLHLGMMLHECFKLISYSADIKEIYGHSYTNFSHALNLLFHVLEKKIETNKAIS